MTQGLTLTLNPKRSTSQETCVLTEVCDDPRPNPNPKRSTSQETCVLTEVGQDPMPGTAWYNNGLFMSDYHHINCLGSMMVSVLTSCVVRGRRGRDRMVVGFTTTYAICAFHHWYCEFEPRSWRGVLNTTLWNQVRQGLATCQWFSPGSGFLHQKNWMPWYY